MGKVSVRIKVPEAAQQTTVTAVSNSSKVVAGAGKALAHPGCVVTGCLGAEDPIIRSH